MKAFLASVAAAAVLAWGASLVMGHFSVTADQRYVGADVRVGTDSSVATRNFSGERGS